MALNKHSQIDVNTDNLPRMHSVLNAFSDESVIFVHSGYYASFVYGLQLESVAET